MDRRQQRVVAHIANLQPLEALYTEGLSPDDVKAVLLELFKPYSENHDALQHYVVNFLVGDAITLSTIQDSAWAMQLFREALRVHRVAIAADREFSLRMLGERIVEESAALSTYWSQYHLARELEVLDLEEFVHKGMRLIGTMIEGTLKPFLYGLAHQIRIIRGQRPTVQEVNAVTLGNAVELLVQFAPAADYYSLRHVRLSQWRNIAQHFAARVRDNIVICTYQGGRAEVELTRDELLAVVVDVANSYKALKVAHAIVFFDHLDEMRDGGMLPKPNVRPEASLTVLASALASQGFRTVDASFTDEHSQLVVQDVSNLNPSDRRFHTTQFVIPLFFHRPAARVTVEYRECDGTPSFRTSATRELLERAQEAGDWHLVARESELSDLKART